jgi:hypothetical protein
MKKNILTITFILMLSSCAIVNTTLSVAGTAVETVFDVITYPLRD